MLQLPVPASLRSTLLTALALTAAPVQGTAADAPRLELAPCQLEHPLRLRSIAAECGALEVPETPGLPHSRMIRLRVARIPAISHRRLPDPLVVLAGGPGLAATTFYTSVAPAFERVLRERDVVLIDQRGTGGSNALECALDEQTLYYAEPSESVAQTRRCLRLLSEKANVAWYTTSMAVQDLERVRAALGIERLNLYGSSYGTRIAQHYLRRFPQRTRAVILDGVVPPELAVGAASALDGEAALDGILSRCARMPACRERFGDPAADYREVRARLAARPAAVALPDPTSGAPRQLQFSRYHFATVLRLMSYSAEEAALLPLLLHEARQANYNLLAAQYLLLDRSYGAVLAYGMHNSVVCTEDVPFYGVADREQLQRTYLGTLQLDGLLAVCGVWPRGPIDIDLHAPLHSDVPVLLLSGGDDPVTPPAYAARAQAGLRNSVHVVLQGFGHGQLRAPCIDRLMADFLRRGSISGLDVSCARNAVPLPFFTSTGGPAP